MIEGNKILRIRCKCQYGGSLPIRLRIMSHAADRVTERSPNNTTIVAFVNDVAHNLMCPDLLDIEKPYDGMSVMYYMEKGNYMIVVCFNALKRDDIKFDVIIETYLNCKDIQVLHSNTGDHCIAILKNGHAVTGKHNDWFA